MRKLNALIIGTGLLTLPVYTAIQLPEHSWQLDSSYWMMAWFDNPGGAFRAFVLLAFLAIADLNAVLLGVRLIAHQLRPAHTQLLTPSERVVTGATLLLGALCLRWLYSLSFTMLAPPAAAVVAVGLASRPNRAAA